MANNQESRKFVKTLTIFFVLFSVLMIACGYLKSEKSVPFNVAKIDTVYITSEEQILSLSEAMFNDECILTSDIHISNPKATIGTEEYPFKGVFDGNGHTIYLSYENVEDSVSLFGKIAEGAVVKNVNFVIESTNVSVNNSFIARLNEGTISNCTVSFPNLEISAPSTVTPFISTNKGVISNVYATGKFVNKGMDLENEKKTMAAAICIYNWGIIENSIVEIEYSNFLTTDKQAIFDELYTNEGFAGVVFSNAGDGISKNNKVIVDDRTFILAKPMESVSTNDRKTVFNDTTIFKALDFDNRFWALKGEKLTLILAEG